jgi:hypothetical protein
MIATAIMLEELLKIPFYENKHLDFADVRSNESYEGFEFILEIVEKEMPETLIIIGNGMFFGNFIFYLEALVKIVIPEWPKSSAFSGKNMGRRLGSEEAICFKISEYNIKPELI